MEAIDSAHPKGGPAKPPPPSIITVGQKGDEKQDGPKPEGSDDPTFRQARTPKHTNKTMGGRGEAPEAQNPMNLSEELKPGYPTQAQRGPPQSAPGFHQPPYQTQGPPSQGYFQHSSGEYGAQAGQRPPFEGAQRRPGPPMGGGPNGAFTPHDSQFREHELGNPRYYNQGHPPTVSPGGASYYGRPEPPREFRGGPSGFPPYRGDDRGPPPHQGGVPHFDHQGGYGRQFSGPPPNHPHQFRGQPHPNSGGYQEQRQGYGGHPQGGPQFHGRNPAFQPPHPEDYQRRQTPPQGMMNEGANQAGAGSVTRAVSSSFDKSVRSRTSNEETDPPMIPGLDPKADPRHGAGYHYGSEHRPQDDNGSVAPSDDSSWRQLGQVASIDEDILRAQIEAKKKADTGGQQDVVNQPRSNSSSLTNSPTDQKPLEGAESNPGEEGPTPSKLAKLDSLSSVASAQEPMTTEAKAKKSQEGGPPSPGSSNASLDLMKCSSGSSGLLQGFPASHQRDGSIESISSYKVDQKRQREERDTSANEATSSDSRQSAPPTEEHPAKRSRHETANESAGLSDAKKGEIDGSPSNTSPTETQGQQKGDMSHSKHPSESNFSITSDALGAGLSIDKAPSYGAYSIGSNHSLSRDDPRRGYPPLSNRPGSSASSTIPPHPDVGHREGIGPSFASWDLQAQDSFGAGSIGGAFSFSQDYPLLSQNDSNIGFGASHEPEHHMEEMEHHQQRPPRHSHGPPPQGHHDGHPPAVESRNQSFEGGHYHGSFDRSHSMDMGYGPEGQHPSGENYKQYTGPFPPHAPSWGTATSKASTAHPNQAPSSFRPPSQAGQYGQFSNRSGPHPRNAPHQYQGSMMRNFSDDSGMRTSPPPGPHSQHMGPQGQFRGAPSSFQPPVDFAAPQNPHLGRRPPQQVYIMSSPPGGHAGPPGGMIPKRSVGGGVYTWTKEDDARLTEVMKKYKNPRDWEPIAKEHGRGKTAKECHERWIRYLKPGVRKGQWQDHEDALVVEAVTTSTEQPFTRWSDLAQRLPGRVGKQIRDRWVNHLNPNINHMPFSKEDDLNLWNGHKKYGKRWVEISTKCFDCSRSENHIKNRWYSASFKKFIANEFGPDAYNGGKTSSPKKESKSKSRKSKTPEKVAAV